jgi:hypothetical protein
MASKAAKRGFEAEERLIDAINSKDELGKKLIQTIEDLLSLKLVSCSAEKSPPRIKSDLVILCHRRSILISVKEFDVKADFNHVERNYVEHYAQKWSMPRDVYVGLKRFVGEVDERGNPISTDILEREAKESGTTPGKLSKKRRTFINQLPEPTRKAIKEFFTSNKEKIIKDIFVDDEDIKFFIIIKREGSRAYYYIVPTKDVFDVYGSGDIIISPKGSLQMGKVGIQRKSGDHQTPSGWVDSSASQLQFKIKPSECIKGRNPLISEKIE